MKDDQQLYEELRAAVDTLNTRTVSALDQTKSLYADGMRDIMLVMKKRSVGTDAIIALNEYIGNQLISWPYASRDFKKPDQPTHRLKDYHDK